VTMQATHPMPADRSRWAYVALIASVAVNLLFVGLFMNAAWHLHTETEEPKTPGFLGFIEKLPADRQAPLRQHVTSAREALNGQRAEVRQAWLDANALLTAEPFDKAKFSAALETLRQLEANYRTGIYGMVSDTAAMLTPDERKLLQQWRMERRAKFLNQSDDKADTKGDKPLTN
jgi:uncharacterized membrane protein